MKGQISSILKIRSECPQIPNENFVDYIQRIRGSTAMRYINSHYITEILQA